MDSYNFMKVFLLFCFASLSIASNEINDTSLEFENTEDTKVLSRRKRYLIFPDGSSFQLVFCTQNMGYLQIGDVVWFGNTAALAWELPTDPNIFHFFKEHKKIYGQRRQDNKHIIFLDENGKVISTKPYRRKPIINPAFAKRSVDAIEEAKPKFSIKEMHETHKKNYFQDLDKMSVEFHRESRKSLYAKLETFIEGLGWKGKECISRMLCESANAKKVQGMFIEEIVRATFTLPRSHQPNEELEDYDVAHSSSGDCAKLYPDCDTTHINDQ